MRSGEAASLHLSVCFCSIFVHILSSSLSLAFFFSFSYSRSAPSSLSFWSHSDSSSALSCKFTGRSAAARSVRLRVTMMPREPETVACLLDNAIKVVNGTQLEMCACRSVNMCDKSNECLMYGITQHFMPTVQKEI